MAATRSLFSLRRLRALFSESYLTLSALVLSLGPELVGVRCSIHLIDGN